MWKWLIKLHEIIYYTQNQLGKSVAVWVYLRLFVGNPYSELLQLWIIVYLSTYTVWVNTAIIKTQYSYGFEETKLITIMVSSAKYIKKSKRHFSNLQK